VAGSVFPSNDIHFVGDRPLSDYVDEARKLGRIIA
jgi:hypothetical protein